MTVFYWVAMISCGGVAGALAPRFPLLCLALAYVSGWMAGRLDLGGFGRMGVSIYRIKEE